eukprot:m.49551 g.49551  ORF g.49551 m.49551 type:complete len:122 (-) comp11102_c0_seq1:2439-2804(-)
MPGISVCCGHTLPHLNMQFRLCSWIVMNSIDAYFAIPTCHHVNPSLTCGSGGACSFGQSVKVVGIPTTRLLPHNLDSTGRLVAAAQHPLFALFLSAPSTAQPILARLNDYNNRFHTHCMHS